MVVEINTNREIPFVSWIIEKFNKFVVSNSAQMKTVRTSIICVLVAASLQFCSCSSAKSTAAFTPLKKQSNSLVVFSPYVEMVAKNDGGDFYLNDLMEGNAGVIIEEINAVLDSRYDLVILERPPVSRDSLFRLLDLLDQSPKSLPDISIFPVLPTIQLLSGQNLAMFIAYHADFPASSGVTGYSFWIGIGPMAVNLSPNNMKPRMRFSLIVVNTETGEVVCYDKISSAKYDPRIAKDTRSMTKLIIKSLYYK